MFCTCNSSSAAKILQVICHSKHKQRLCSSVSVVLRLYIMFSDREILHISSQRWFRGNWPIRKREILVCWIDTCADGVCCWLTHLSWSGWPCCVCVVMSEVTFTSSSLTRCLSHSSSLLCRWLILLRENIYYILDFPETYMHKLQQPMNMYILGVILNTQLWHQTLISECIFH